LLVVGLICLGFIGAGSAATQGICGDNITWSLDEKGDLAITGTGDIYDYDCSGPWGTEVRSVTLSEGIQHIGNHAFSGTSIIDVCIPGSVTSIGTGVFDGCMQLELINVNGDNGCYCDVDGILFTKDGTKVLWYPAAKKETSYTVPGTVTSIGEGAFSGCSYLEKVIIEGKDLTYDDFSFKGCSGLKCVVLKDESKPDDTFWSFVPKKIVRYLQGYNPGNLFGYYVVVLNGGILVNDFEQHGMALPTEDKISRDGYTFDGWYADSELTSEYSGNIIPGSTVYAKWIPNTYTVELDGNGATSPGTSSIMVTFEKNTFNIPEESESSSIVNPKRTGYRFAGWYTGKTDGTLIIDSDGKFVENVKGYTGEDGVWCRTGDTTLYAHWEGSDSFSLFKCHF